MSTRKRNPHIVIVDNYDSFTFNIYQYCLELGVRTDVVKNDELAVTDDLFQRVDAVLLSPGPGRPQESGISFELLKLLHKTKPFLGVCLGHQIICEFFGATVINASRVMHGKVSGIEHDGKGVFSALPKTFDVARYHSLITDPDSLPSCLEVSAWVQSRTPTEIMGVRHKSLAIESVQFHPEAILTEYGHEIIANFMHTYL